MVVPNVRFFWWLSPPNHKNECGWRLFSITLPLVHSVPHTFINISFAALGYRCILSVEEFPLWKSCFLFRQVAEMRIRDCGFSSDKPFPLLPRSIMIQLVAKFLPEKANATGIRDILAISLLCVLLCRKKPNHLKKWYRMWKKVIYLDSNAIV